MKTVKEALLAAGPMLEVRWNAHSEIADGAARAGVAAAEAVNSLDCESTLKMQVVQAIMRRPQLPNYLDGLKRVWKDAIADEPD